MISHFQWKELRNNLVRREWTISFFHKGQYITGIYHQNGTIAWNESLLTNDSKKELEPQIHELMLYHVYEEH
ncbi:YheE family protein [Halalkalibacter nanhaiisediminis]|uniref:YheE family protein n=1 Tax=Halalkalibacter nanhaiisediminis TaxID=688079 RepID=A0A562QHH6_9BACI|nr:YheE family protein [Halalkalibacter nanhaiisediminis]TWI56194.1 hypothetical protein IQ10_02085 [Halalkalibacter nanhaiisediminis]